jgi:hypothetical protein
MRGLKHHGPAIYEGRRGHEGAAVVVVEAGGVRRPLRHYVYHSPTGFEWGYGGSGPADLALALAADVIGDEEDLVAIHRGHVGRKAWNVHLQLLHRLVCFLNQKGWDLPEFEVRNLVMEILNEQRAAGEAPGGPDCQTCGGDGTVDVQLPARHSAQESPEYREEPCPDCQPEPEKPERGAI